MSFLASISILSVQDRGYHVQCCRSERERETTRKRLSTKHVKQQTSYTHRLPAEQPSLRRQRDTWQTDRLLHLPFLENETLKSPTRSVGYHVKYMTSSSARRGIAYKAIDEHGIGEHLVKHANVILEVIPNLNHHGTGRESGTVNVA